MCEKTCENCHSYKGNNKKVLMYDGVCFLVPSKPKFKKRKDSCVHWTKCKEGRS